jgi:threonine dehydratase
MIYPSREELRRTAKRIASGIHRTPVLQSAYFDKRFSGSLFFKCENFQKAGAFKSRGAVNAVFSLSDTEAARGVATHSSGNHAQALARAAALRNIPAYIVMPENAPAVKINAVKDYGGKITFCRPTLSARESTLREVIARTGASEIHPYNNLKVIAGQATATMELLEQMPAPDFILCPVGGGGLLSGTALAAHYFSPGTRVVACEPDGADDAFRSFRDGKIIPSQHPKTIADGLLTSLGSLTFPIIREFVSDIVTVSEQAITEAMRLIFERMKIVVEPSAAVPMAAILENKIDVSGKNTGIILSGGNVDMNHLPWCKTDIKQP